MKLSFWKNCRGITLIELMVALVIGAVLLSGLFTAFVSQHRSYTVQDQISTIQQGVRAGMNLMKREISVVGLNPCMEPRFDRGENDHIIFGIMEAEAYCIRFAADITGAVDEEDYINRGGLDPTEEIMYFLGDFEGDGDDDLLRIADPSELSPEVTCAGLGAVPPTESQLVIENIANRQLATPQVLFTYQILADGRLDDDFEHPGAVWDGDTDSDGIPDFDPDNRNANWDRGEMITIPTGNILNPLDYYNVNWSKFGWPSGGGDLNGDGIPNDNNDRRFFLNATRIIIITPVVRSEMEDPNYIHGLNIRGIAADGTCRTRTLSARVRVRNLGLGLSSHLSGKLSMECNGWGYASGAGIDDD